MAKNVFKQMYKGTTNKKTNFNRPEGAGNFDNMDDYNIAKSVNTQQGTIQHNPTKNKDLVNKEYVDNPLPTVTNGLTVSYEDINFTSADSPIILDIEGDIGHNSSNGYIVNDGNTTDGSIGDILIEISSDGIIFSDPVTIAHWGEWLDFTEKDDIKQIRLTWVEDTAYRALFV